MDEWKTWQVWARKTEDDALSPRDRYIDLDVACEMAEELVKQGYYFAVVKNMDGDIIQEVGR